MPKIYQPILSERRDEQQRVRNRDKAGAPREALGEKARENAQAWAKPGKDIYGGDFEAVEGAGEIKVYTTFGFIRQ